MPVPGAPGAPGHGGAPIHQATAIGAVHLTVRRLAEAVAFYRDGLGLVALASGDRQARLGAGGRTLVVLHGDPGAAAVQRTTGLYHLAILLPSRRDLAAVLRHLAATGTPLAGASDHLVSEALYLEDSEGNGIEVYRDRLRAEWRNDATGAVTMATRALDLDRLLAEPEPVGGGPWRIPDGAAIGHVHLRVNDVPRAERFYVDVLGFELTARYGHAASFVSAGGYHHHIGFNMWDSAGAPPPPEGAAGLARFEVRLPHQAARDAVVDRLRAAGHALQADDDNDVTVRDPSGNRLVLALA